MTQGLDLFLGIVAAGTGGGLLMALLGFAKARVQDGEKWDSWKFVVSGLTAFLTGVGLAAGELAIPEKVPVWVVLALAFLAGAGVDVARNRVDGVIKGG